jgi:hypothetical protein
MTMTPNDPARLLHIDITIQPGTDNIGQPLDGFLDGFFSNRQLCASDRPLRDAALELIDLGAPPDAMLTARHLSWRRQITTTLANAAQGLDAGFDTASVVLPFRRRGSVINPRGGDAA